MEVLKLIVVMTTQLVNILGPLSCTLWMGELYDMWIMSQQNYIQKEIDPQIYGLLILKVQLKFSGERIVLSGIYEKDKK